MSYAFGVGTLTLLTNNLLTGCALTTGSSGAPASNWQVSSGLVIIDGVTCIVSATSGQFNSGTGSINTGSGLLLYAYIAAGSTTTGTVAVLSATDPVNTSIGIPTAICPLAKFSFGTGTVRSDFSFGVVSGASATRSIGKVQNVSINVSYDQAQMRGGADVFPVDTQFSNGSVEGSFEFSDPTASQFLLFGGNYTSGGASGTWTLTGVCRPEPVSLVFQTVTNGITGEYTIPRAYLTQQGNDFSRTDYMQPSYSFVAQTNYLNQILRVQQ